MTYYKLDLCHNLHLVLAVALQLIVWPFNTFKWNVSKNVLYKEILEDNESSKLQLVIQKDKTYNVFFVCLFVFVFAW